MNVTRICLCLLCLTLLSGCIAHQQYRTNYQPCALSNPQSDCRNAAMQFYHPTANPQQPYSLSFIEFDDQGQLWDRAQMRAVIDQLNADAAKTDLLLVVFVHGWKHSAAPLDHNISMFRKTLQRLSALENQLSSKPRQVSGVYLGWRGGSVAVPVLKELTFWERKATAHKVGYGGVTEVLGRLELLRRNKHAMTQLDGEASTTRLVVVGHSFGGAVVYSALSKILEDGFVHTQGPETVASDTLGFGDLVVLINPAFEALRFTTLSDMANERKTYFASQLPALAILTSETDYATKYAFPAGRWFSTLFEKERQVSRANPVNFAPQSIDQGKANITTVGHFDDYNTHYLKASADALLQEFSTRDEIGVFSGISRGWEQDRPGSAIDFGGSVLIRNKRSVARNPFLNIKVDTALIPDHNNIDDPRIEQFVRQLILLSSQSPDLQKSKRQQRQAKVDAVP